MNRVKEEFVKFGENISVRGISKIVKSKRKPFKIMWLCAAFGCSGILTYQLVTIFLNYSSYPYRTSYGELPTPNIFPSITICSMKPKTAEVDYDIYSTYQEYMEKMVNVTEIFKNVSGYLRSIIQYSYIASLPKFKTSNNDFLPFLIDAEAVYNGFRDRNCIKEEIIYHRHHYDCYLYQIPKYCITYVKSLTMIFFKNSSYIDQNIYELEYSRLTTDGIQVVLSAPGVVGDISKGFNLAPGTDTLVEISMKIKTILDKPYNSEGCESKKYVDEFSSNPYNSFVCFNKCVQEALLKICNCVSGNIPVPTMYNNEQICGNTTLADKLNSLDLESQINRTKRLFHQYPCEYEAYIASSDSCESNCKKPCVETYYEQSIHTLSDWPKLSSYMAFIARYMHPYSRVGSRGSIYFKDHISVMEKYFKKEITLEQLNDFIKTNDGIASNFLQVTFSFTSDHPITITDTPVYTWDSVLGNIGGSLSFWMGITIMTFVEIIEFLCNVLCVIKKILISSRRSSTGRLPV